jgi:hypothetical protein
MAQAGPRTRPLVGTPVPAGRAGQLGRRGRGQRAPPAAGRGPPTGRRAAPPEPGWPGRARKQPACRSRSAPRPRPSRRARPRPARPAGRATARPPGPAPSTTQGRAPLAARAPAPDPVPRRRRATASWVSPRVKSMPIGTGPPRGGSQKIRTRFTCWRPAPSARPGPLPLVRLLPARDAVRSWPAQIASRRARGAAPAC